VRFLARQPVFDRNLRVYGYELLFRSAAEDFACIDDSDRASSVTLDNSLLWGLDQLCERKLALVNCTRAVLTKQLVEMLPPKRTILEVLEDVRPDDEVIEACRSLKGKGYAIALDDVTSIEQTRPYLGTVEMVKVDFRLTDVRQRTELAEYLRDQRIIALAEKVETREEYRFAIDMGYALFQGFFFQRPELMRTKDIPPLQAGYFRLLEALQHAELDFAVVEQVVKTEPTLCLRLLRYLNSPLFAFGNNIVSVQHALSLLGEREIRKWLLVSLAAQFGRDKPVELVLWALTRARFCELLADKIRCELDGSFLAGMLSAFPALLELPLERIVRSIPVESAIKEALLGDAGPYRDVLDIASAYEAANWGKCSRELQKNRLTEDAVSAAYLAAVRWAEAVRGN